VTTSCRRTVSVQFFHAPLFSVQRFIFDKRDATSGDPTGFWVRVAIIQLVHSNHTICTRDKDCPNRSAVTLVSFPLCTTSF